MGGELSPPQLVERDKRWIAAIYYSSNDDDLIVGVSPPLNGVLETAFNHEDGIRNAS